MPDRTPAIQTTLTARAEAIFPVLAPAQVARIRAKGRLRQVDAGEVLVESGQHAVHFFVLVAGEIEIARPSGAVEELVAVYRPGMFTGEANMLSGRRSLVRIRASKASEVIDVEREELLETSLPGVFAVGDVRGGNIKRVASAVGEGSIAVAFVHQVLHE